MLKPQRGKPGRIKTLSKPYAFKKVVKQFGVDNKKSEIERIRNRIKKLNLKIEKEFETEFGLESYQQDPKKFFNYQFRGRALHFKFEEIVKCKFGDTHAVIK